jgi:HlyD family secretion protein
MKFAIIPIIFGAALMTLMATGCSRNSAGHSADEYYTVRRGNLDITVLTSGSLETASPTNIVQKIGRSAKIINIVPEGTVITQADIDAGRILVEFDCKDCEDALYERQTTYDNAVSSAVNAEETLAIQISDNESTIRNAELEVIYAENDFKKLVGEKLAADCREKLPEDLPALLDDPRLEGSVLHDLTTYRSDIELAQTEVNRAEQTLEYTKKLYDLQFVSKQEYENDQLTVRQKQKSLQTTKGKYDLYIRFDFVKNVHKTWATWQEAKAALHRAEANAKIKLSTAETKLRSAKQALSQAEKRLKEAKESLENCTIRATVPGLVVYQAPRRWENTGPIQAGSEIRNQQTIIRLPNLDKMQVKTNIHEAQIDMLAEGMKAVITIDALPGQKFTGKIANKGLLPSAENEWLNPDLKVYDVRIGFDNCLDIMRPGMTASAEILVEQLKDVLYVPIQAVQTDMQGRHFCVMADGSSREVQLGKRSRSFVEVTSGLEENDQIFQTAPETVNNEK